MSIAFADLPKVVTARPKKDPPIRKDHRCARPGCRNELMKDKNGKYVEDPFCSSECCRIYYGVTFPKVGTGT